MDFLKAKSDNSIRSAKYLHGRQQYPSSVHCSYYSCVQLMLHVLRSDLGKSEKQIDEESRLGSNEEGGFHNWLLSMLKMEIFRRDANLAREFSNNIGKLKGARVEADYKNKEIKQGKAADAIYLAEQTLEILKEKFKV